MMMFMRRLMDMWPAGLGDFVDRHTSQPCTASEDFDGLQRHGCSTLLAFLCFVMSAVFEKKLYDLIVTRLCGNLKRGPVSPGFCIHISAMLD